jgi:hypothetical protein
MNDAHSPGNDEFESLERQLRSLRPAEVPAIIQARLQFELGRTQGRREARRAMFAYASAACLAVWAGTTWLESSNSPQPIERIVRTERPAPDLKPSETRAKPTWSLEDIQKLARYEAAVRGDAWIGGLQDRSGDSQNATDRTEPDSAAGPWNRQRWMQELMADPSTVDG